MARLPLGDSQHGFGFPFGVPLKRTKRGALKRSHTQMAVDAVDGSLQSDMSLTTGDANRIAFDKDVHGAMVQRWPLDLSA